MKPSKPATNITYAGYIRVSSEEQKRTGLSPEHQDQKIRQYVELKDGKLHKIYVDLGYSGGDMNRPDIKNLLADAKQGLFTHIVFTKLDRFSRNARDLVIAFEDLDNLKINISSISENLDTSTATGSFVLGIMGQMAQLERKNAKDRTEGIHLMKLERGEPVLQPPYGYRWKYPAGQAPRGKANTWITHPQEAANVKTVFENAAKKINNRLTTAQLNISTSTYYYLLKNKTYLGLIQYKNTLYKGQHESLITIEQWESLHGPFTDPISSLESSSNPALPE